MTTNTKTWTAWLDNPGDGVCPVPEWAEDYRVLFANGKENKQKIKAERWGWNLAIRASGCDITHYRYAVPEDLAWLAREESEWRQCISPFFSDEEMLVYRDSSGSFGYAEPGSIRATRGKAYTQDQWLRARQDLGLESPDGKPSWADAPEWAEWLCQQSSGAWFFYSHEPEVQRDEHWAARARGDTSPFGVHFAGRTEVHGDWRNTLERRPEPAIKDHDARDRYTDVSELNRMLKELLAQKARKKLAPIAGGVKMTQQHTSDGSTASYYELPEGATELQHLISHRNMNAQDGEIFRAIYRKGLASHSDELRDAKKVLFYAQAEVDRLEKLK